MEEGLGMNNRLPVTEYIPKCIHILMYKSKAPFKSMVVELNQLDEKLNLLIEEIRQKQKRNP